MSIRFDSEARIFVLETAHTSYHMKVDALGHLLHLYYGKTIGTGDLMQLYPRTDPECAASDSDSCWCRISDASCGKR